MLLSAPLLALALAWQDIPDKASVIYTGIPVSAKRTTVQMVTHNASVRLDKTTQNLESLTYLKNLSSDPATVTLIIPVKGHNVDWAMTENLHVSAMVDNIPISLANSGSRSTPVDDQHRVASGVHAEAYENDFTATIAFTGRQAHSIRVYFSSTLGHAGLDGAQRVVAYDTSGGSSWNGEVGQLNYSLKYTPRIVFQVFAEVPQEGWETGSSGAFIKKLNASPAFNSKFVFTYYPGGYDKIGGG